MRSGSRRRKSCAKMVCVSRESSRRQVPSWELSVGFMSLKLGEREQGH